MDKAHSSVSLTEIDLNDVILTSYDVYPSYLVDLGFAVSYEIKLLKSKEKVTYSELVRFKKELPIKLSKLVSPKTIVPTVANKAKSEYHKFVTRTVKERKTYFLNFDKKKFNNWISF